MSSSCFSRTVKNVMPSSERQLFVLEVTCGGIRCDVPHSCYAPFLPACRFCILFRILFFCFLFCLLL